MMLQEAGEVARSSASIARGNVYASFGSARASAGPLRFLPVSQRAMSTRLEAESPLDLGPEDRARGRDLHQPAERHGPVTRCHPPQGRGAQLAPGGVAALGQRRGQRVEHTPARQHGTVLARRAEPAQHDADPPLARDWLVERELE